jgi:hypothetical protein
MLMYAMAYADVCRCRRILTFSTRQHTSAYISIRQHSIRQHTSAHVTSAYVSIRILTFATRYGTRFSSSISQTHTSAYVSIRQHTSAYVSISTFSTRYGTRFSSSMSHTFWQYGHHPAVSLVFRLSSVSLQFLFSI